MKKAEAGALRSLLDFLAEVSGAWGPGPWTQAIASLQETPALAALVTETTTPVEPLETWLSLRLTPVQWEALKSSEDRPLTVIFGAAGTGKTHMAAMLAGYWLSKKKRVLLTSACPRALERLRQIPLPAPPPAATELMRRLGKLETQQLEHIQKAFELSEAARAVREGQGKEDWIPGPISGNGELPISVRDVDEIYSWTYGDDLESSLRGSLPDPAKLMTEDDLARLKELEVPFRDYGDEIFWQNDLHSEEALQALLSSAKRTFEAMEESEDWWLEAAWHVRRNSEEGMAFEDLGRELTRLEKSRDELTSQIEGVTADLSPTMPLAEQQQLCQELLNAVASKKGGLGWATTAFKPRWKKFLEVTRVNGEKPSTADDFRKLQVFLERRKLFDASVLAADEEIERLCGYQPTPPGIDRTSLVKSAVRFHRDYFADFEKHASVAGLRWEKAMSHTTKVKLAPGGELKMLRTALKQFLLAMIGRRIVYLELAELRRREERHLGWVPATKGVGKSKDTRDIRAGLRGSVVSRDVETYKDLLSKLYELVRLKPIFERRKELLTKLAVVAPAWVDAINGNQSPHDKGRLPGDVEAAWAYRLGQQRTSAARPEAPDTSMFDSVRRMRSELSSGVNNDPQGLLVATPEEALASRDHFDWVICHQAGCSPLPHALLLSLAERAVVLGDPAQCHSIPPRAGAEVLESARKHSLSQAYDGLHPLLALGPPTARLTESLRLRPQVADVLAALGSPIKAGYHLAELFGAGLVEVLAEPGQLEASAASLTLALLRQPEYSHRTVALITLAGATQAARLRQTLAEELQDFENEIPRLTVGSAEEMQGGQWDLVVLLADGLRSNPQARRRLEVGVSRALDQVWVVHRLAEVDKLPAGDLRRAFLSAIRAVRPAPAWPAGLRGELAAGVTSLGYRPRLVGPWGLAVGHQMLLCYGEKAPTAEDLAWENGLERHGWQLLRIHGRDYWDAPERFLAGLKEQLLPRPAESEMEAKIERAAALIRKGWPAVGDPEERIEWDVTAFTPAWRALAEKILEVPGLAVEPGDAVVVVRAGGRTLELRSPDPVAGQEALQDFLRDSMPAPRPGLLAPVEESREAVEPGPREEPVEPTLELGARREPTDETVELLPRSEPPEPTVEWSLRPLEAEPTGSQSVAEASGAGDAVAVEVESASAGAAGSDAVTATRSGEPASEPGVASGETSTGTEGAGTQDAIGESETRTEAASPAAASEPEPEPEESQGARLEASQVSQTSEPESSQAAEPAASQAVEPEVSQTSEPEASQEAEPVTSQAVEPEVSQAIEPETNQAVEPEVSQTSEPEASQEAETVASQEVEPEASQEGPEAKEAEASPAPVAPRGVKPPTVKPPTAKSPSKSGAVKPTVRPPGAPRPPAPPRSSETPAKPPVKPPSGVKLPGPKTTGVRPPGAPKVEASLEAAPETVEMPLRRDDSIPSFEAVEASLESVEVSSEATVEIELSAEVAPETVEMPLSSESAPETVEMPLRSTPTVKPPKAKSGSVKVPVKPPSASLAASAERVAPRPPTAGVKPPVQPPASAEAGPARVKPPSFKLPGATRPPASPRPEVKPPRPASGSVKLPSGFAAKTPSAPAPPPPAAAPVAGEPKRVKPPSGKLPIPPAVRPPAVRPPTLPGASVRPPVRPVQPAAPVDDLAEVRKVMLKAFRMIKPQLPEVVQELIEGVTSVALERKRTEEQRRAPRLNCHYDVRCVLDEGELQAAVTEVSLTGARVELPERLSKNTLVELHPRLAGTELEPVRCSVRWCRQTGDKLAAGLAFHESPTRLSRSWVAVLLHSLGFGEDQAVQRRKNVRVPTNQPIHFTAGETAAEGIALDIGVGGLLVESDAGLSKGDVLTISLGSDLGLEPFSVDGIVVSVRSAKSPRPRYGVQFLEMTPSAMTALGDYLLKLLGPDA